jgi:osmotically inducible protein OsmC
LEALYIAAVEVKGGRQGQARTLDGSVAFELALPTELGGVGGGTNPEQLLAAACAAAFGSALDLEARQLRLELTEISVTATVSLGHGDDGNYAVAIELRVCLPEVGAPIAERLLRAAEGACPYCRMIRGNIELRIVLTPPPPANLQQPDHGG